MGRSMLVGVGRQQGGRSVGRVSGGEARRARCRRDPLLQPPARLPIFASRSKYLPRRRALVSSRQEPLGASGVAHRAHERWAAR